MYDKGDIVTVRKDLVADKIYNGVWFVNSMAKYMGRQVTIDGRWIRRGGARYAYHIEEDDGDWTWTEEMFEQCFDSIDLDEDGLCRILEDLYV